MSALYCAADSVLLLMLCQAVDLANQVHQFQSLLSAIDHRAG